MSRELTMGDKNVVYNLRSSHKDALAKYSDEVVAHAWRIFSQSDEYTGHPETALLLEWVRIAESELSSASIARELKQ